MSERYVMYLRKSRADEEAERRGEGETLARHERALLETANRLKLHPPEAYREIVSGDTLAARPVMRKLLAEVEAGLWTGVLVMEVERLARGDTVDQGVVAQTFRFSGTKIITPSKIYDPNNEFDEEYFEFGLFMSRREYKTINRRLQRGRLASVKEGKYAGSAPPYGYDRKKLEREKGYILVPNPEQAAVVRLIFTLYASGEETPDGTRKRPGVCGIVRRLNDLNVPPQRGDVWVPASVRDMLKNPVYTGKLRWNWRKEVKRRKNGELSVSRPRSAETVLLTQGRHEAIVPPELFDAAQERLSKRRAPSVQVTGVLKNPLAGLVICGKCGRRMQRRPYPKKGAQSFLICPNAACDNVSSALAAVESRILSALRRWMADCRLTWSADTPRNHAMMSFYRQGLARLEKEIGDLERQRGSLHDLLERGVYDAITFLERNRILADRLRQAERDKETMTAELIKDRQREADRNAALPKAAHPLDVYDALTPAGKNFMLKELLEKVVYIKESDSRRTSPDSFNLDLFPKIPRVSSDK